MCRRPRSESLSASRFLCPWSCPAAQGLAVRLSQWIVRTGRVTSRNPPANPPYTALRPSACGKYQRLERPQSLPKRLRDQVVEGLGGVAASPGVIDLAHDLHVLLRHRLLREAHGFESLLMADE